MLQKLRTAMADDNQLDSESLRFLSLVFLLLAAVMSFLEYTHVGWLWDTHVSFAPGFLSSIFGLLLIAPLYLRRILKWNKSIFTIISFILILMVFSSFVELALGGNGMKSSITMGLLGAAFVLSWLGIRSAAGIAWILVLAAAVMSAIVNNLAMGFWGFVYVCSGALGLILHSGLNPGEFMQALKVEYSGGTERIIEQTREDVNALGSDVRNIAGAATMASKTMLP
jgi:hypothetical protein